MITVYICSREEWENNVTTKPKCPVHYFPETLYSYRDWYKFYKGLDTGFNCVVTQSSEMIMYLGLSNNKYKIYIWENNSWLICEDLRDVSLKLLSCYEELMIEGLLNDSHYN